MQSYQGVQVMGISNYRNSFSNTFKYLLQGANSMTSVGAQTGTVMANTQDWSHRFSLLSGY